MHPSDIRTKIISIRAKVARHEKRILDEPDNAALIINTNALRQAARYWDGRFQVLASQHRKEVCRYYFEPTQGSVKAAHFCEMLLDYQKLVGLAIDTVRGNKPRRRAVISEDVKANDYLDLDYLVDDLGVALSSRNDRGSLVDPTVHEAVGRVFELAKCEDSGQLHNASKQVGPAALRLLHDWTNAHLESQCAARIVWTTGPEERFILQQSLPQFEKLKAAIQDVSQPTIDTIELTGVLQAANARSMRFLFELSAEDSIFGTIAPGVLSNSRQRLLPHRYTARLERTEEINFATNEPVYSYRLLDLSEPEQ